MGGFFRLRARSFRYAFAGWWYVIRTQKNAWIHAVFSIAVLALAFLLNLALRDLAVLVVTIGMVWMAEFLNTALEAVVDLASPQLHPLAKVGKDVGAACCSHRGHGFHLGRPAHTRPTASSGRSIAILTRNLRSQQVVNRWCDSFRFG